jgi:chromosome segregation ATPase
LASYLQQKDELKKHLARATSEREKHEAKSGEIESELGTLVGEKEKGNAVLNKLTAELDQMKDTKGDDPLLQEILPHVEKKHGLAKQLKDFKEACTKERAELRREAAEAQEQAEKASQLDEADETLLGQNRLVKGKAQELQQEVSKASRAALFLGRSLDDIPNSYELTQYQKRFLELYDLIQLNLQETRSHYNTYNTLSDTKEYLHKEAKLMGSIYKGFMASSKTNSGQRAFLDQLEGIAKGVDKTLEKYQSKYSSQKDTLDASKETYQAQLQLQRQYLKTLADLQKSVNAYETLSSSTSSKQASK